MNIMPDVCVAVTFPVPLVPQPDKLSCWCGSMAMLVSYSRSASIAPEELAEEVGRSLRTSYGWDMLETVKDHFGFVDIDLPSNASLYPSPQQWNDWLNTYGPLWVTVTGAPSHAIIVRGVGGDLTPEGTTVDVNNPWDITASFSDDPIDFAPINNGAAYTKSYADFALDFATMELSDYGKWRVLYLPAASSAAQTP
jgi:hypothetical protein